MWQSFFFSHQLFQHIPHYQATVIVMGLFSNLGTEAVLCLILGYLVFSRKYALVRVLGLSFFISTFIVHVAKVGFDSARPLLQYLPLQVQPGYLSFIESSNGLPSGHSQVAMSFYLVAALLTARKPLRYLLLVIAILMPLSRLYFAVHYPGDVILGLAIGLVVGLGSIRYADVFLAFLGTPARVTLLVLPLTLVSGAICEDKMVWVTGGSLSGFLTAFSFHRSDLFRSSWAITISSAPVIKIVSGFIILFSLRIVLKTILPAWPVSDFIRYFTILLAAVYLLPTLFEKYSNLFED